MISPESYFTIYFFSLVAICVVLGFRFLNSPDYMMQEKGYTNELVPLLLCLVYAYFLGDRPISRVFGDTINYAKDYEYIVELPGSIFSLFTFKGEWLWYVMMYWFKTNGFSVHTFFIFVSFGYFFFGYMAMKEFMPKHVLLGVLFMMTSLMFYTFGTNGIRNGLACHITLYGFSLILRDRHYLGIFILYLAFSFHKSVILPAAAFCAAYFFLKNVKWAITFWIASIFLSLLMGGWFINFFASLGFDDRMAAYGAGDYEYSGTVGFRWDFLLYSSIPVLMTWYIFVKKQIEENWYRIICVTYCLSNAFWVLVIRASYSNRFAYLSWFMYPIIIAYPLIMLPVWEQQDSRIGYILIAYLAFTGIMNVFWHNF